MVIGGLSQGSICLFILGEAGELNSAFADDLAQRHSGASSSGVLDHLRECRAQNQQTQQQPITRRLDIVIDYFPQVPLSKGPDLMKRRSPLCYLNSSGRSEFYDHAAPLSARAEFSFHESTSSAAKQELIICNRSQN